MRTVDFSRPTKFTNDHQRRIARAIDTFCQTAATRLSAELRWPIELEAINTTQVTWSARSRCSPASSLSVILDVQPIGTRMLLSAEQAFVLMALECFLGGSPDRPPRERRLTEIDWSLTHRLFDSIVNQLSLVWQDLAGLSLVSREIELHNDSGQVASVSEPTLVVVIESRINKLSSMIALLIPWIAIEPVASASPARELADAAGRHGDVRDPDGDVARSRSRCAQRSPRSSSRSARSSRSPRAASCTSAARPSRASRCSPRTSGSATACPAPTAPGARSRSGASRGGRRERQQSGDHPRRGADAARGLDRRGGRAGARHVRAGARPARAGQVLPDAAEAFSNLPFGAVAASVSYVDGVTGANVFVMTPKGARALAVAMGVPPRGGRAREGEPIELSELELSAVSEASNQMMAAAASAIGVVLGQECRYRSPTPACVDDTESALDRYGSAPLTRPSASFTIDGEICRLIQLVPSAFVVRMVRAIDELNDDESSDDDPIPDARAVKTGTRAGQKASASSRRSTNIRVRVWAELGRTQLPLGRALELPLGAVVDLDCAADAPVDLYVNGLRFAQGQLLVTDDGDWAVSLETLGGPGSPAAPAAEAQPQLKGALT